MIKFTEPMDENVVNDALNALDRWYIAASSDEWLWIQPRKSVLDLREFCTLLKRIHRVYREHPFKNLVLHFEDVEVPRSLWVIILRLFTAFAKTMQSNCRVIRSIKVKGSDSAGRCRIQSAAASNEHGHRSTPTIRLNGTTIIIQPEASGMRGLDEGRYCA